MYKLDQLNKQGFTILKNAFPKEMADQVKNEYKKSIKNWGNDIKNFKKDNGRYMRLANFHNINKSVQELFNYPKELHELCSSFFLQKDISIYTSLFFQEGTEQDIHRDAPLFCTYPENNFLGCWFALEDTSQLNGSLAVIPKGHNYLKDEEISLRKITTNHFYKSLPNREIGFNEPELWVKYQELVQTFCREKGLKTITLPVSKGDIIVWHPMLPHGGSPIKKRKSTRYSIVFHVVPNKMRVYGNDLFFEKEKFNNFLEVPPSIALSKSVFMQIQTCNFMDEGRQNLQDNIISKSKNYLKNKIIKVKSKLKGILKK
tara:strand:+ start:654 stop:1601 length:948 start_codon:yes stop_codon:yes gene_type:complete